MLYRTFTGDNNRLAPGSLVTSDLPRRLLQRDPLMSAAGTRVNLTATCKFSIIIRTKNSWFQ